MKILILDIETSPNIVYSWRVGRKINLTPENIIKERAIICVSYKWDSDKKPKTIYWDDNQCDRKLLKELSKIIIKADEIVTQNGESFDLKWINGRLAFHSLDPLGPLTSSDTLRLARKVFYLNSFKLDYMGDFFKLGRKKETGGFQLWKDIMETNCPKALKKMGKYCEQDVMLLERIYEKILRYNPSINKGRALTGDKESCPNCALASTQKWGIYTTRAGLRYQKYRCTTCGTVFKLTTQLKDKKKKKKK